MLLTFWILAILHSFAANAENTTDEIPCRDDQLPCDSIGCISKGRWCDSVVDCEDGSDEYYCANPGKQTPCCKMHHFQCLDQSCIPLGALCDGVEDCNDGSDESKCNNETSIQNIRRYVNRKPRIQRTRPTPCVDNLDSLHRTRLTGVVQQDNLESLLKSKRWLMAQQRRKYGWGANSARAMVALALAKLQNDGLEGNLMVMQLNIQIMTDIMRNTSTVSPSKLALNINALLATCQNPRNFQGVNLVKDLRFQADSLMESNKLVHPFILLTLCLVKETKPSDFNNLYRTFSQENTKKLGLQALTIISMQCIVNHQTSHEQSHSFMRKTQEAAKRLMAEYIQRGNASDVYTTALVIQCLSSILHPPVWDNLTESKKLLSYQQDDGSFGGFLSTCHAIPALARENYLSLENNNCSRTIFAVKAMEMPEYRENLINVRYSLWIGSPVADIHTVSLKVASNWNFFEIMKFAAAQNDLFGFKYDDEPNPQVHSLAGIPNDVEREFHWVPYRQDANVGFKEFSAIQFNLMDRPFNGDHVIFWFKHKNYNPN